MLNPWTLLSAQIVAHASLLYMLFTGTLWEWGITLLVYFLTGCLGMTMTYHRLLAHRSWQAPKWFVYLGTLFATLGLTGSAISWVAIHRKHHRFADSEKDPHCPSIKGFFYCHWLSMFEKVEVKYAVDLAKDNLFAWQHRYYFLFHVLYACALAFAFEPRALIYAWLTPAAVLWNGGSSIVTFSHMTGAREANGLPRASNSWLLGWLVWGEGWHSNHHDDPSLWSFRKEWWQFDLGGALIGLISRGKKL